MQLIAPCKSFRLQHKKIAIFCTAQFSVLIILYAHIRTGLCADGFIYLNTKYNFMVHEDGQEELRQIDRNMDKFQLEQARLTEHHIYHLLIHEYCQSYEDMLPIARALKERRPDHHVILVSWPVDEEIKPMGLLKQRIYEHGVNVAFMMYTIHWLVYNGAGENTVRENSHVIGHGLGAYMVKIIGWCLQNPRRTHHWDGTVLDAPESVKIPWTLKRATLLDIFSRCIYDIDMDHGYHQFCRKQEDWNRPDGEQRYEHPFAAGKFAEHITVIYTSRGGFSDTCPQINPQDQITFIYHKGYFINNEGYFQSGCPEHPKFNSDTICRDLKSKPCSHQRAIAIYVESICVPNSFNASRCIKYGTNGCEQAEFVVMGNEVPKQEQASYYINTNSKPPYSRPVNCYNIPVRENGREQGRALYCY